MMTFALSKRAKRDSTLVADRRYRYSPDKRLRVTESSPRLGGLSRVFYATAKDNRGWSTISRHRTRNAATEAVQQFHSQETAR